MKVQSIIAAAVLVALGAAAYQYLTSNSLDHRVDRTEEDVKKSVGRIDVVEKESRVHGDALQKQEKEIRDHAESIGTQAKDIVDLQKRVGIAETRISEMAQESKDDRAEMARRREELEKVRADLDALVGQKNDDDRRRRELDDLRKDLKRSLDRSVDLEKRLTSIEKQLGIERPQP